MAVFALLIQLPASDNCAAAYRRYWEDAASATDVLELLHSSNKHNVVD